MVRKHCGRQPEWGISLEVLQKKAGSSSPRRVFRAMVRDVIAANGIPDYVLALDADDLMYVTPRTPLIKVAPMAQSTLWSLAEPTLLRGRSLAPGWDIYGLEVEWREMWHRSGQPRLRSPDKAFLAGWKSGREGLRRLTPSPAGRRCRAAPCRSRFAAGCQAGERRADGPSRPWIGSGFG